eukprot:GILI01034775.1.p1 GENE.GILI01034775.1~~GILI01034775.1.p1  ORF type:complete len:159 (+),score=7.39 GILI01034775.1:60-536(+)
MSKHIQQDWRNAQLHFVLESRLMMEKYLRDTWLQRVCTAVTSSQAPISRSMPMSTQTMFTRKVAAYHYNQYGLMKHNFHILPNVDRFGKMTGTSGTKNWVPYYNTSAYTFRRHVSRGHVLVHRVFYRGVGTDKAMLKGGYEHRWNKTLEMNRLQYNRI